jgi:hypothetical protein
MKIPVAPRPVAPSFAKQAKLGSRFILTTQPKIKAGPAYQPVS